MAEAVLLEKGKYYGYPMCCIQAFIKTYPTNSVTSDQIKASKYTGFIPCVKHTEEILAGKIQLEHLILPTRLHPKPFTSCSSSNDCGARQSRPAVSAVAPRSVV